ncbi:ABC transporter substrate-binding protein, partial [Escherichia coli]|nr:ABC transporter substrate-binding protein [Escherichia coli]
MKKSWLSMLFLIIASVTLLSACGSSDGADTGSGDSGESGGPVTMTFFAPQGKAPMEENEFTRFIENKFNVKLKWDLAPTDALQDRRQLLLASGDYPEVFLHGKFTTSDLQNYGKQGVFIPLNDLIQ